MHELLAASPEDKINNSAEFGYHGARDGGVLGLPHAWVIQIGEIPPRRLFFVGGGALAHWR